jgi:ribose 5-phosphate isomerase B
MKIFLGADHRGFKLKEKIKLWLKEWGKEYEDMGNSQLDSKDDYPDYAAKVAEAVSRGEGKGVLLCHTGTGMDITANKYPGVRSVLGFDEGQVRHGVEAEAVNILSLGVDYLSEAKAKAMLKAFLETEPSQEERHLRRREKISKIEEALQARGKSVC